jgi:hypothetical protein
MSERLVEKEAPLGLLSVTVGIIVETMESRGSPSPRVPLGSIVKDSELTVVVAATNRQTKVNMTSKRR